MITVGRPKPRNLAPYLITVLLTLPLAGCSRSEFKQQHQHAVLQNPVDVELEIRTSGGKRQFALSEQVAIEEFYTSKYSGLWHIEVLEGWNEATAFDVVHISDGKTIWEQPRQQFASVICCESRHVWLSLEPIRIPFKLADGRTRFNPEGVTNPQWLPLQLPKKPGKYRIYLTTRRVFGHDDRTITYTEKGRSVSSNILDLEVK